MDEVTSGLKSFIHSYLNIIFKIGLVIVLLSTFFLFSNLTTEIFDTPKVIVLLAFVAIFLVLLTLRFTIAGKVVLVRTPLDIPLLLLLAVAAVSTFLSTSPYVALLGDQLRINGSLVSLAAYLLFYFVLVNNLKNAKEIKWIFGLGLIAAQALAVVSLLTYMGVKILPDPWTHGTNFTTTGSTFSTTAVLALLLPFAVVSILTATKPMVKVTNAIFLTIMGLTIALTGTWSTWIGSLAAVIFTFLVVSGLKTSLQSFKTKEGLFSLGFLLAPIALVLIVSTLSFLPMGSANILYTKAQSFPREIQLPFNTSWKVSVSAFRDVPFWGTGPSTYAFNFTNYKPVEFNSFKFWNLRFDTSFNEYLLALANLGSVGLIALVSLTALFISAAYKTIAGGLSRSRLQSQVSLNLGEGLSNEKIALAISGLVFFIILGLHSASLALWVVGLLVLASFMVLNIAEGLEKSYRGDIKGTLMRIAGFSAVDSSTETIRVDALPGILLAVSLAGVLALGFFGGKIVLADYHHRLALNAIGQNQGVVAYNELVQAEKLNPVNDLYRTDLAQTNFALANAIASAKAPTEASPTGSLTDQDKQNIQVLLQQSINEGKIATTLSPRSSINWEILALLYRQIAGVAQNALLFSLDSYGRAIFQDPLNPVLRVNVGGVYYAIQNYDLAIRFFTDAINLKSDYPNAYYNLSVALKDKGDLNNAQSVAEKLVTLVDAGSQDYKVASDYLADLKSKISPTVQPPAATASGALQNEELPKVVELPKPEKIATPEAVKKTEASPTPAASVNP